MSRTNILFQKPADEIWELSLSLVNLKGGLTHVLLHPCETKNMVSRTINLSQPPLCTIPLPKIERREKERDTSILYLRGNEENISILSTDIPFSVPSNQKKWHPESKKTNKLTSMSTIEITN